MFSCTSIFILSPLSVFTFKSNIEPLSPSNSCKLNGFKYTIFFILFSPSNFSNSFRKSTKIILLSFSSLPNRALNTKSFNGFNSLPSIFITSLSLLLLLYPIFFEFHMEMTLKGEKDLRLRISSFPQGLFLEAKFIKFATRKLPAPVSLRYPLSHFYNIYFIAVAIAFAIELISLLPFIITSSSNSSIILI